MPSLSELRRKIKGVRSTQQITKAMKMIAGARLARAQKAALDARPYARYMADLSSELIALYRADNAGTCALSRAEGEELLLEPAGDGAFGVVVVTSDKGLCGSFNNNIIRNAQEYIARRPGMRAVVFAVGRKACDAFRGLKAKEYPHMLHALQVKDVGVLAREIIETYLSARLSQVTVIYNAPQSMIKQQVTAVTLLPLSAPVSVPAQGDAGWTVFEPGMRDVAQAVFPEYVISQLYRICAESYAAELAARMTAMDNASRNAHELIESVTLSMNKVRQSTITRELTEIVGTSEVLK
jgi:F-type H+-transporting ATPase subunit gamma